MKNPLRITTVLVPALTVLACVKIGPVLDPLPMGPAPYYEGNWTGDGSTTGNEPWSGNAAAHFGQRKNYAHHGAIATDKPVNGRWAHGQESVRSRYLVNALNAARLSALANLQPFLLEAELASGRTAYGTAFAREPLHETTALRVGSAVEQFFDVELHRPDVETDEIEITFETLDGKDIGEFTLTKNPLPPAATPDPRDPPPPPSERTHPVDGRFEGSWIGGPFVFGDWENPPETIADFENATRGIPVTLDGAGGEISGRVPVFIPGIWFDLEHVDEGELAGTVHGSGHFVVWMPQILAEGGTLEEPLTQEQIDFYIRFGLLPEGWRAPAPTIVQTEGELIISGEVVSNQQAKLLTSIIASPASRRNDHYVRPKITGRSRALVSADRMTLDLDLFGEDLSFGRAAGTAPTVTIRYPSDNASFLMGDVVRFEAEAPGAAEVRWSVGDSGGAFGPAPRPSPLGVAPGKTRTWASLAPGFHTVTIEAISATGHIGSASVTIRINSEFPHDPVIVNPAEGSIIYTHQRVVFTGAGYDPENGATAYGPKGKRLSGPHLLWAFSDEKKDDPPQPERRGSSIQRIFREVGPMKVTLTARDLQGQTAVTRRTYEVLAGGPDKPPVVVFKTPKPSIWPGYATVKRGDPVNFLILVKDEDIDPRKLTPGGAIPVDVKWEVFQVNPGATSLAHEQQNRRNRWTYTWPEEEDVGGVSTTVKNIRHYRVRATATDSIGRSNFAELFVTVLPKQLTIE